MDRGQKIISIYNILTNRDLDKSKIEHDTKIKKGAIGLTNNYDAAEKTR